MLRRTLYGDQMVKTLIAFSEFGGFSGRQSQVECHGDFGGMDHFALSSAGMHIHPFEADFDPRSVEAFVF
ncbi:hypothetical protein D3C75_1369810 [compost metagenome]